MKITTKTIYSSDVTKNTGQEIIDWGFTPSLAKIIITSLMTKPKVTLLKNDVNDYIDYNY